MVVGYLGYKVPDMLQDYRTYQRVAANRLIVVDAARRLDLNP